MAEKNVIITKKARKKLVRARAGDITLPKVVGMAFGDGGVDEGGQIIAPTEDQDALKNELLRKAIDGYQVIDEEPATVRYKCTLLENELAGKNISELALYDSDNDLVCIKTFSKKGKDDDIEITFSLDDVF